MCMLKRKNDSAAHRVFIKRLRESFKFLKIDLYKLSTKSNILKHALIKYTAKFTFSSRPTC